MKKTLLIATAVITQACGSAQSPSTTSTVTNSNQQLTLDGGTSGLIIGSTFLTLTSTITPAAGLQANDTTVTGTNAYITYNTAGSVTAGAIDQINVTVPSLPTKTATLAFPSADINGAYADGNGNVYAIGADTNNGALAYSLAASTNALALSSTTYLPGHTGTAIKAFGSSLYTLTGENGGLNYFLPSAFAAATPTSPNLAISDARGFDQSGSSNIWAIAGGGGLYEVSATGVTLNTVQLGGNSIAQSKSNVHVGTTTVAASLGSGGASIVCMSDHNLMGNVAQGAVTGFAASDTVSNSVTFGDGMLFVANGAAGVAVYSMTNALIALPITGQTVGATTACGKIALAYQGVINFGNAYSANNVYYKNGILYVATGTGGFKVVVVDGSALGIVTGLATSL